MTNVNANGTIQIVMIYKNRKSFIILFGISIFLVSSLIYWIYRHQIKSTESHLSYLEDQAVQIEQDYKDILVKKRQSEPLNVPILLYHYVEIVTDLNDTFRMSQSLTPKQFEDQIVTLLEAGFTPVHMEDLYQYFQAEVSLPQKAVVLTFDDGYQDFYTDVFPILQKYNIKATIYVVSGFVDLNKNYLTSDQLNVLAKSSLVEIGSHSVNHYHLSLIPLYQAVYEIGHSKQVLEASLGKKVEHFAYPYGSYNELIKKLAEDAGFKTAVTIDDGLMHLYQERFSFKRTRSYRLSGQALIDHIQ